MNALGTRRDPAEVAGAVASLLSVEVPAIGAGATASRWHTLASWARATAVSVARLAEAHLDATAILGEADLIADQSASLYGVWASGPASTARLSSDGSRLEGIKPFCSGIGIVDRALVSVAASDGTPGTLVEVQTSRLDPPTPWAARALLDTFTGPVDLAECELTRVIATDNWYLTRPGFWHGATGPAACWAGAAAGLADIVMRSPVEDPHGLAACGELDALVSLLHASLAVAGQNADTSFGDVNAAKRQALICRHNVHCAATAISNLFSQHVGPRPFVTNIDVAQRHADLHLYLRQHHGRSDLEALGRLVGNDTHRS